MTPDERRAKLRDARLYLVTGDRPDLDAFLGSVLEAGVDIVQLREKQMDARSILALAVRFRAACDRHGALFILNDRADLALAAGADGVHLGQDDLPPALARRILGDGAIIGRSTHTPDQMRAALDEPVDYVAVGPVFETPTKPGRPAAGFDVLRLAAKECGKPWFAIGGLDPGTVGQAVDAGATRIAVVRAIERADDPAEAVRRLRAALDL